MKMFMLAIYLTVSFLMITPTTQMPQAYSTTTSGRNLHHAEAMHERFRRRINEHEGDGAGPVEYMKNLRALMVNKDGSPKDVLNNPTSTWCLMDNDVSKEQYHPKPMNGKCEMEQKFRFSLKKLSRDLEDDDTRVSKALLRVYLRPIESLIPMVNDGEVNLRVNISARAVHMNNNDHGGVTFVSSHMITVSSNTQGDWEEWNITDGFRSCWSSATNKNISFIEFTIHFQKMQCGGIPDGEVDQKIPIEIVDPAVIPITEEEERNRQWSLQPLVLVYLENDEERKRLVISQHQPEVPEPVIPDLEAASLNANDVFQRRKKRAQVPVCNLTSYQINFADLGIHIILAPTHYNARMCKGDCSKRSFSHLAKNMINNHVRMMGYSRNRYDDLSDEEKSQQEMPDSGECVGVGFQSLTALTLSDDFSIAMQSYPDMSVTECGCRA